MIGFLFAYVFGNVIEFANMCNVWYKNGNKPL